MSNVLTIYRRELAAFFNSPIAYIFIGLFVAILAFLFFVVGDFFGQNEPDLRGYFNVLPWAFAVFIPAVTMRLWSEEKRTGTLEVLMTLPMRSWEIVLGKYLASYTVIAASLLLTLIVPVSVAAVLELDWGMVIASYVGAFVIASVYIALGAWTSTFTHNQIVALLLAVTLCLLMVFLGAPQVTKFLNRFVDGFGNFVGGFGTLPHYQDFAKGIVNPVGLIYAVSLTAFFLVLNNFFVEGRKY